MIGREDEFVANLVRSRKFTQTYDSVNVEISIGTCAPLSSGGSAIAEVKDLELKVSSLRDQMDGMAKDRDGWKAQAGGRDTTIQEQGNQIKELQAAMAAKDQVIERQQGEIRIAGDRLQAVRHVILANGYFKPEEIGDDLAPRITELLMATPPKGKK